MSGTSATERCQLKRVSCSRRSKTNTEQIKRRRNRIITNWSTHLVAGLQTFDTASNSRRKIVWLLIYFIVGIPSIDCRICNRRSVLGIHNIFQQSPVATMHRITSTKGKHIDLLPTRSSSCFAWKHASTTRGGKLINLQQSSQYSQNKNKDERRTYYSSIDTTTAVRNFVVSCTKLPTTHYRRIYTSLRNNKTENDCTSDDFIKHSIKEEEKKNNEILHKVKRSLCSDILSNIYPLHPTNDSSEVKGQYQNGVTNDNPLVILLGVSGGCDSIALFHTFMQLLQRSNDHHDDISESNLFYVNYPKNDNDDMNSMVRQPCTVHVVHFDHQQRGEESDGDRLFVKSLCEQYNLPFHCFFWGNGQTIPAASEGMIMKDQKNFSQEIARNWRRNSSLQLMKDIMVRRQSTMNSKDPNRHGVLFTAHHKDDSEETMLMKLLRGVHITNLTGMDSFQSVKSESGTNGNDKNINIYIAKPMLNVRKSDIQHFLTSNGLEWREDASNTSNKYSRNRVRNELMPLLQDLVGGEDALERRLENLEHQSRKIKDDLIERAEVYIKDTSALERDEKNINKQSILFPLPKDRDKLNIVEEQALHLWAEDRSSSKLSYEKLTSLNDQLANYPKSRQWKMMVGAGWEVHRNGDVLDMIHETDNEARDTSALMSNTDQWIIESYDHGTMVQPEGITADGIQFILQVDVQKNNNDNPPRYTLKSVQGNESLLFLPPWRKGNTSMKIKEFLRGQKVPLHRRERAPIICLTGDNVNDDQIVAVFVESKKGSREGRESNEIEAGGKWIIHADFDATGTMLGRDDSTRMIHDIVVTKK